MLKTILIGIILSVIIVAVLFFIIRAANRKNYYDRVVIDKAVDIIMQHWDKAPFPPEGEETVDEIFQDAELPPLPDSDPAAQKETDSPIDRQFGEAARLVVSAQRCSRRDLQRGLAMGYARAGLVLEQLEAAGIVGPEAEDQSREVLVKDTGELEPILARLCLPADDLEQSEPEKKHSIDDIYRETMKE